MTDTCIKNTHSYLVGEVKNYLLYKKTGDGKL